MAKRPAPETELNTDEVAETLHEWVEWFEAHRKQVLYTSGGLLALLLLLVILSNQRERSRGEMNTLFNRGVSEFMRMENLTDPKARAENETIALQTLGQVIDDHGGTSLGNEARLVRGKLHFGQERYPDAQRDFTAYIEHADSRENKARGQISLAYTFENEAFLTTNTQEQRVKLETARQHYTEAQKLTKPGTYLHAYARLGEARYHELINEKPQAIQIYEEIMKSRPAPVPPASESVEKSGHAGDIEKLRHQLDEDLKAFSFETAAKLRLDRLRAEVANTTSSATTVVTTP